MNHKNFSEETVINGFFTKIVSLMFVCSVFISGVDVSSAQIRTENGNTQEKSGAPGEVYLESNILQSSDSVTIFGQTLPGAHLEVRYPSGITYEAVADSNGHFKLKALPLMNKGDVVDIIASIQDLKISEHLRYNR